MSTKWTKILVAVAAVLALSGCGDDEGELALFSRADAERYLRAWAEDLEAGNVEGLLGKSAVPFRFRSRTWKSEADFKANIRGQLPAIRDALSKATAAGGKVDYFSYLDLEAGRWPERATVAEEDRPERIAKLGVRPDGFVAWVHVGRQSLALFILNPPTARDRLLVQGIPTLAQ